MNWEICSVAQLVKLLPVVLACMYPPVQFLVTPLPIPFPTNSPAKAMGDVPNPWALVPTCETRKELLVSI